MTAQDAAGVIAETDLILDSMLEALGDEMCGTDIHPADKARRIQKYLMELLDKAAKR